MKKVVIIDYGAGNLFSVQQAFKRLGIEPVVSDNQAIITNASHVVFPGVGHAKTAMEQLKVKALDVLIPQLKQPVLGICLGMQLLCEFTEEGAVEGLGVFRSRIELLSDEMIVPHMGWNDVGFTGNEGLTNSYYFVHSYKASISQDTWGICNYGQPFSAALKRNNFYGVQFHPEKSSAQGTQLLTEFLQQ
ncbi:MAG: imidazole glycerol phosphate synthase, glutamine amidotransferase subunit [Candidatus Fluviicola riflensis]|nr:MAG: imidazole glycerol phosphate synthase subunit HisH [Candidatus Fluviicola riflensis]OGS79669.1 MAG: imidazole glycerol phosphate synthase, glutamine amidotransferase subunit [Candidatus Fluviicola riflensis]OGS87101.1 MAG: imidazole glycerol phosphate synthase, glutamine amidotransferase subunit [Fluviicola sp. RIFCSPHIGHO2_01_FULL_43_53]OGS89891.1 MAG: imidazole glycerol phosphate synthase, glutamine amidotransferase subunit [Fluviicola sp. RIFCSPHIGHO2_12_FULL_43_24]